MSLLVTDATIFLIGLLIETCLLCIVPSNSLCCLQFVNDTDRESLQDHSLVSSSFLNVADSELK